MGPSNPIQSVDDLMRVVAVAFDAAGIDYFVTGSQASVTFGEPRFTNDVDLVARLQPGDVDAFCDALDGLGDPDLYVDREAVREAVARRDQFNILHTASGLKADVMLPRMGAYDRYRFDRRVREKQADDTEVAFASPEDVILAKLVFYKQGGSEKHIRDISGILKVQGDAVDMGYLDEWAYLLDVGAAWKMILAKVHPPT